MEEGSRPSVAIVGAGVVGTSLGIALAGAGYGVTAVGSRSEESARRAAERIPGARACRSPAEAAGLAEVVLLTTPDRAIGEACTRIAADGGFQRGACVLHVSGALDAGVLEPAARLGCATGSWHPLQSFAAVDAAPGRFAGTYFFFEGADAACARAAQMTRDLGGRPVALAPGRKRLYHAAAVIACNYLVTLAQEAAGLMTRAGVPGELALPALLPLMAGTLENLRREGVPKALTGPIARGDAGTVAGHLGALREWAPDLEEVYRVLGRRTVPIGLAKGTLAERVGMELLGLLGGVTPPEAKP